MVATSHDLGILHRKLTGVFIQALDRMERLEQVNIGTMEDEDLIEAAIDYMEPSPALLAVIARFLKDNDITALIEIGDTNNELKEKFAQMRSNRGRSSNVHILPIEDKG